MIHVLVIVRDFMLFYSASIFVVYSLFCLYVSASSAEEEAVIDNQSLYLPLHFVVKMATRVMRCIISYVQPIY
jgi:hypothetical protein